MLNYDYDYLSAHVPQVLVSPLAIKPLGARNAARHVICPRGDWKRPLSLPAHEVMVDASADTLRRIPLMMVLNLKLMRCLYDRKDEDTCVLLFASPNHFLQKYTLSLCPL